MRTVSIIIRQQPKLTPRLKEFSDNLIESLISLCGDMEFLFSDTGEFEVHLLSAIDKTRKKEKFSERKVITTLVTEETLAECGKNGFFFDRVAFFIDSDRECEISPLYLYTIERSDFFLYYAVRGNKDSEDLVRYVRYNSGLPLNLSDHDNMDYIDHREI